MIFRNTKQKKVILEAVINRLDHPTAEAIYQDIHKNYPNISLSTVYRNLEILSIEGKIKRIKMNDFDRFDSTLTDHNHIICKKCGKMCDVLIDYQKECDMIAENASGFIVEKHSLLFEGICPECQEKEKGGKI